MYILHEMKEKRITIRLDENLYVSLKEKAKKEYLSITAVARRAIALYLERGENNG